MFVLSSAAAIGGVAKPITGPWPQAFPAKDLCSNCGLCRSSVGVTSVTEACAFLGDGMSRAEQLEAQIHGRCREFDSDDLDEAHFGVHDEILLARGFLKNSQWTGVATGVALAWLESGAVDAVVVASSASGSSGFGAPKPLLCRTAAEVLQGRRVKPSLCPSLEVLDEVAADASIRRLLFCGVGCAVQALRALSGASPEAALGLDADGLYVLGTHCVDNSPTPEAARRFVSALPGVGAERSDDVLAYGTTGRLEPCQGGISCSHAFGPRRGTEFMADFRVHARMRERGGGAGAGDAAAPPESTEVQLPESVVKPAYMTLPPSIGIPSIAPSCFSCFDYTNGLADLVVGYMGAPFTPNDEMVTAPLMVTADSMVKSLTDADFVAGDAGAPPLVANMLANVLARTLPKGMEFGRYSIDYHYLRNQLYVEQRMGRSRAARHVCAAAALFSRADAHAAARAVLLISCAHGGRPSYARALMQRYENDMEAVRRGSGASPDDASRAPLYQLRGWAAAGLDALFVFSRREDAGR